MYQYKLIEILVTKLKLESNISLISIVDYIKILKNLDEYYKILEEYKNPTEEEAYIIKVYTSKEAKIKQVLSQNFFSNIFLDIFLMLNNPYNVDAKTFDIFYDNHSLLVDIHQYVIKNYEKIISSDLHKFYNIDFINRWIKTIIHTPLTKDEYYELSKLSKDEKDIKWTKYNVIWPIYNRECEKFKEYLYKLKTFYESKTIPIVGCFNISKKLYEHCLESNIGIKLNIPNLEKFALKKLDMLVSRMKGYIKKIDPSIDDKLNVNEMLKKINYTQKFKSKKEFIDHHKTAIKKYEKLYLKDLNFCEFTKVNLVVFDNKHLGSAYYNDNNFYLNSAFYHEIYKYTTETLVLHEAIPGHHLQVHTTKYVNTENNLLYQYFPEITNGFVEGWGLFCEKLGKDQTTWDLIGQTEYDMLRTLRVIVDIRIHYYGQTVDSIYEYMKNYLSILKEEVMTEIYRYVCMPGQAVSYKVGCEIYKAILKKNNIKYYLDDKSIEIYKKIIKNGSKPLKFLVEEYGINVGEIFKE
jgi:hypothetical protein